MRVGAVDIGTNTTRLLVADVTGRKTHWLVRRATVTTLGQGVDVAARLHPDAIARTLAVLAEYAEAIVEQGCDRVRAVATSAVRDAANGEAFLDAAGDVLAVLPELIGGDDEAALAFAGTTAGLDAPAPFLVVDLGGGSTEFVLGTEAPEYAVSVRIGSVRLTERAFPGRPVTPGRLADARTHVDELMQAAVHLPVRPGTVMGVGGTYTSLAAIHNGLETYSADAVHGTVLSLDDLHELTDRLALLGIEETAAFPSLDPARAPVLLGGALVAERSLRHTGEASILVSERDILDGIALSAASI